MKLISVLLFMNEFGRTLVTVYLPLYFFSELNAPFLLVGLGLTISTGTSALFQMFGGILADSWGRRRSMILSTSGKAVVLTGLSIASIMSLPFLPILLLFTISEALNGIFLTSTNAMISDVVELKRRVEGFGIYRVAVNLGFTLGSLFGGLLILYYESFLIWTVLTWTILGTMLLFLVESGPTARSAFKIGNIISAGKDRLLLGFALISVAAGMVANQMGPTFALYTTAHLQISKLSLGYLYALNGVMIIFFQYAFSRYAIRHRLTSFIAIAAVIQGASYLLVGISSGLLLLQMAVIGLTIGEMLSAPTGTAFSAAISPDSRRGEYIGFYSWGWNSGQALSPVIGGVLLTLFAGAPYLTWDAIFVVGAVCSVAYASLGVKARRKNPSMDKML